MVRVCEMTPEREWKQVERALRTIPLNAIAPDIAAGESTGDGLWCLVAGEVSFVPIHGGGTVTHWDHGLAYAQYARWLTARPERVHDTHESAVAYVRQRLEELGLINLGILPPGQRPPVD
jgi:hypothetical protein